MKEQPNVTVKSILWHQIHAIVRQIPRQDVEYNVMDADSASSEIEELIIHQTEIDNQIILPPVYNEKGKQISPIKKYRINRTKNEIEWFYFCCIHPHHKDYVVVIDMYEHPIRMWHKEWKGITITSYEDAKKEFINHLNEIIKEYSE